MTAKTSRSWRGALATSRRLRNALVAVLVLATLYGAYRYTLHRMVEAKLDQIRKQGYPVTLAELDKWYPQPPPGENAADVYLAAFAKSNTWNTNVLMEKRDSLPIIGNAKLPRRSLPLPDETKGLAERYLADNAESIQLLREAASFRKCQYPLGLTNGFEVSLPHLNSVRQGARLLTLETVLQAEKGGSRAPSDSILDSACLAHSLDREPLLISQLVRMACQRIALTGLERVINRVSVTDNDLSRHIAWVSEAEASDGVIRGLTGELCLGNSLYAASGTQFSALVEGGYLWWSFKWKRGFILAPSMALYRVTGLLDVDYLNFLNVLSDYINAWRQPLPSRLGGEELFTNRIRDLPRWQLLSRTLLPSLSRALIRDATHRACLRAADAALSVERYRLADGALPNSLDALVPKFLDAVPTDPFDGQPLRYKKLAKGYVVYSVGEDGKDDGGDEKKDIAFTVER